MTTIIIVILAVLLAVSLFVNVNQIRKQEQQEDYVNDLESANTRYYTFFQQLKTKVNESNSRIRQVDKIGSFEADDETGFIFKDLQDILEDLNKGF